MSETTAQPSTLLRVHTEMMRDFWFEEKDGKRYLVLRQVTFDTGGQGGMINKLFRLDENEQRILDYALHRYFDKE